MAAALRLTHTHTPLFVCEHITTKKVGKGHTFIVLCESTDILISLLLQPLKHFPLRNITVIPSF